MSIVCIYILYILYRRHILPMYDYIAFIILFLKIRLQTKWAILNLCEATWCENNNNNPILR